MIWRNTQRTETGNLFGTVLFIQWEQKMKIQKKKKKLDLELENNLGNFGNM